MSEKQLEKLKNKAAKFCAWRDRCIYETEEKLLQWNANKNQAEIVLKWLEKEGFIDESRFATNYAKSKLNNNYWGRKKIEFELNYKKIDKEIIEKALNSICEIEYDRTVEKLANKKLREVKAENEYIKKQKTMAFLVSKGFETEIVSTILEKLLKKNNK